MTEHRNLKRAVRARMRKTGENYTAALLHVGPATSVESSERKATGVPMSTSTTQLPTPAGWSRWTGKARLVVERHATDVAAELGHERVGTEHLLAGFWGEPGNVALQVLEASGLTRAAVVEGIETNAPRGSGTAPAWTRESLATLDHVCTGIGIGLGHNYVATEHLLLFIICDQGSVAESILAAQGLSEVSVRRDVLAALADRSKK